MDLVQPQAEKPAQFDILQLINKFFLMDNIYNLFTRLTTILIPGARKCAIHIHITCKQLEEVYLKYIY
jgi:hypothetical protein